MFFFFLVVVVAVVVVVHIAIVNVKINLVYGYLLAIVNIKLLINKTLKIALCI